MEIHDAGRRSPGAERFRHADGLRNGGSRFYYSAKTTLNYRKRNLINTSNRAFSFENARLFPIQVVDKKSQAWLPKSISRNETTLIFRIDTIVSQISVKLKRSEKFAELKRHA